jgi:DNA-binding LacI/PurR family transcriptional regulator
MADRGPFARPAFSPATEERGLERSPAPRRAGAVALVIAEPFDLIFNDPYLARLVRGLDDVLQQRELQLLVVGAPSGTESRRAERYLTSGCVDGAALVSVPGAHPLPAALVARGIPLVFAGRPSNAERFSYVDVDNVAGAAHAVTHLASGGRRSIATITGRRDIAAGEDRLRGYREGLTAAGLEVDQALIEPGDFTRAGGMRAMRFLLIKRPQLDAVFVASDLMAAGALEVLAEAGRRVPEDVAVVGFDDDPMAATLQPPLTSVRQPVEEQGREMGRLVLSALSAPGQPPRKVILSTRLEVRLSSAPTAGNLSVRLRA